MKKYYGYIRVSTTRQGEHGVSLQEQKEAIQYYADRQNLEISTWFEEQETAAKKGRPVFSKMLRLLRLGNASGLIVHKIDRSARNLKDWADLGELIDSGVEVHFANESLDLNSRGGRLSADIQAVVASDYIRNLREETKKGFYGRLKQGLYPMPAPLGYLNSGKAKVKIIDPTKGPLVRQAFELYATAKFNLNGLCDEMFNLGLRNRKGAKITDNGMSTILRNPFYVGIIKIKKVQQVYQGAHEPLVSRVVFDRVQEVLSGKLVTRAEKHDLPFRRMIFCKFCSHKIIGETKKGHVYYRCHTRDCPNTGIRQDAVESVIIEKLKDLEFDAEEKSILEEEILRLQQNWFEQKQSQLTNLNVRLQQITGRLNRLTDAFLDGALDQVMFAQRKEALLFERRGIEEKLNEIRSGSRSIPDDLKNFVELAGTAYLLYENGNIDKRRRVLQIVSSNLALNQKSIEFTYALPFNEVANRQKISLGSPSKVKRRILAELLNVCARVLTTPRMLSAEQIAEV